MDYEKIQLRVDDKANRLELAIEGAMAFIEYKLHDKRLFLVHTEVPAEHEGKGVGGAIVKKALQYAKDNDYKIIPICPFVQSYLKRHEEWSDIVAPDADRFMNKL